MKTVEHSHTMMAHSHRTKPRQRKNIETGSFEIQKMRVPVDALRVALQIAGGDPLRIDTRTMIVWNSRRHCREMRVS